MADLSDELRMLAEEAEERGEDQLAIRLMRLALRATRECEEARHWEHQISR